MAEKNRKYTSEQKQIIGNRINKIRLEKGMTLEEFGKLFGATKSNVSKWCKGQALPNPERMKQIAKIGDTTISELIKIDEVKPSKKLAHKETIKKVLSITLPDVDINEDALNNVTSLVSELDYIDFSLPDIAAIYTHNQIYKRNQVHDALSYLNYLKPKFLTLDTFYKSGHIPEDMKMDIAIEISFIQRDIEEIEKRIASNHVTP